MQSNRKRPAPGTSPLAQHSMPAPPTWDPSQINYPPNYDNGNFDFTIPDSSNPAFDFPADPSIFGGQQYNQVNTNSHSALANSNLPVQSTEIVRRPRNNQLTQQQPQHAANNMISHVQAPQDSEGELDEATVQAMIAQAKKGDGNGKRKDIPPFVKKLSNFLNQADRTNLIRWSDDGLSFIVLDEDEFARTMIPELFKHNNYASFVRQLNMYGFHKAVDIKDGSLQQSELARSNKKPPSTYKHRWFRRNRPDLLWLISKPSAKATNKRPKREGKEGFDSDEERYNSPVPEGRPQAGLGGVGGNQDVMTLPRNELNSLKQELSKLQQQQNMISSMITKLKQQNDQFYRQASQFQSLHDRHENSINAILTFLATFYNRSLEDQEGQNLVNMFSNVGPNNQQPQGGVVEEFNEGTPENTDTQLQRYVKRPQLLLTGSQSSPSPGLLQPGNSSTTPISGRRSISPPTHIEKRESSASATPHPQSRSPATTAIANDAPDVKTGNDQMTSAFQGINQSHGHSSQLSGGNRQQLMNVLNQVSGGGSGSSQTQAMQDIVTNGANSIADLEDQQRIIGENIRNVQGKVQRISSGFTPPLNADPGMDFGFGVPNVDGQLVSGPFNFKEFVNDYDGNGIDAEQPDYFQPDGTNPAFDDLLNGSVDPYAGNDDLFGEDDGLDFNLGSTLEAGGIHGQQGKVESLNSSSAASPAVGTLDGDGDGGPPDRKRLRTG